MLVVGLAIFEAFNSLGVLLAVVVAIFLVPRGKSLPYSVVLWLILILIAQPSGALLMQITTMHGRSWAIISASFGEPLFFSLISGLAVLFVSYMILGGLNIDQVKRGDFSHDKIGSH